LGTIAGITGIIMVVCMVIAYSTLLGRRKHFERFWYTHHLLIVMIIAFCVHGTESLLEPFQGVYWVMVPFALYIVPRIYRETCLKPITILDIQVKKGGVVALKLAKPACWKNYVQAGM